MPEEQGLQASGVVPARDQLRRRRSPQVHQHCGAISLICTPTISGIAVSRTLIDGGAGLNVISVETFEKMRIPRERLTATRPFVGATNGTTIPLGRVRLPVTFGTRQNYHTETLDFDVARIGLPYNAIIGYPALAKFMAATHHAYNLVKMPGSTGTLTVHGAVKDAVYSLEHAYKEAAVSHPINDDSADHLAGPPKKKQLFSQERAATKKVFLNADGTGATLTIGAGMPPK